MGARFSVSVERGVAVPMRDGTVLLADIYRPSGPGRYPVILTRTAYDRTAAPPSFGIRAAGEGYVLISQDIRGRYESGGSFHAFPNEANDGYDTCAWICEQPWSNGRIGTFGGSYVGLTQWQAALAGAPGLQAMVPNVTAADYHEGWCYQGGAFELSFIKSWTLTWLATDTARRLAASDPAFQTKLETLWDRCDAMEADFVRLQYVLPGHEPHRVRAIVTEWMEERPLPLLRAFRAAGVAELFARLSESHVLAVHSDYRAERKLAALGLAAQLTVAAEDVGRLKPDPAGLHRLMAQAKAEPARTLMIGDRDERDGEAARRAGVRSLIRGRDFRDFTDAIFG